MSRRRGHHREEHVDEGEESGELNLIPYLDIITTLVIFLVFTFQVVIEFRLIELLPPASNATDSNPNQIDASEQVTLTLVITRDSYVLMTNRAEFGTEEIPKKADGTYDNAKLTTTLARIQHDLNLPGSLIMTADDATEYKVIVAAMDAARTTADGKRLFPDVLLATAHKAGG